MKLNVVNFGATLKELTVMNVSVTDAAARNSRRRTQRLTAATHSATAADSARLRLNSNRNLSLLQNLSCREAANARSDRLQSLPRRKSIFDLRAAGAYHPRPPWVPSGVGRVVYFIMPSADIFGHDRTPVTNAIIAVVLTALSLKDCRGVTDLRELKDCPGLLKRALRVATRTHADVTDPQANEVMYASCSFRHVSHGTGPISNVSR
jgi:hypothetical protein